MNKRIGFGTNAINLCMYGKGLDWGGKEWEMGENVYKLPFLLALPQYYFFVVVVVIFSLILGFITNG